MGNLKLSDQIKSLEVAALVPCRRCARCLRFRQMRWRERAIQEISWAKRTWFITLTFSPHHLAGILIEAKGSETKYVETAAYRHVQLFFKRLRKDGAVFRYLAVFELGEKNGRMHYHLFLHEIGTRPIFKTAIEAQWRSFISCRLVGGDEAVRNASYVTKYATKSFDIRPRASALYGKTRPLQKSRIFGERITKNERGKDDDAPFSCNDRMKGDLASMNSERRTP